MNLFLDLEETIIDDWYSGNFMPENIDKIKNILNTFEKKFNKKFKKIIIFSFAITNLKDEIHFNNIYKNKIQNLFNLKIEKVFHSNNENLFGLAKFLKINILPDDFPLDIFKKNMKEEAFEAYSLKNHLYETNILIDDSVSNSSKFIYNSSNDLLNDNTKNTKIITFNIKEYNID